MGCVGVAKLSEEAGCVIIARTRWGAPHTHTPRPHPFADRRQVQAGRLRPPGQGRRHGARALHGCVEFFGGGARVPPPNALDAALYTHTHTLNKNRPPDRRHRV